DEAMDKSWCKSRGDSPDINNEVAPRYKHWNEAPIVPKLHSWEPDVVDGVPEERLERFRRCPAAFLSMAPPCLRLAAERPTLEMGAAGDGPHRGDTIFLAPALAISNCFKDDTPQLVGTLLGDLPQVASVSLCNVQLDDAGLQKVIQMLQWSGHHVKKLDLSKNSLTFRGLRCLAKQLDPSSKPKTPMRQEAPSLPLPPLSPAPSTPSTGIILPPLPSTTPSTSQSTASPRTSRLTTACKSTRTGSRRVTPAVRQPAPALPALSLSSTLTELSLQENMHIGDRGAAELAHGLQGNMSLQRLNLRRCGVNETGVRALGSLLEANIHLRDLELSWNYLGTNTGALALANALRVNVALTRLSISNTGLHHSGVLSIAEALMENTVLCHLDLSHNQIRQATCWDLSRVVEQNQTLHTLLLDYNPTGSMGAAYLLSALCQLPACAALRKVGLTGIGLREGRSSDVDVDTVNPAGSYQLGLDNSQDRRRAMWLYRLTQVHGPRAWTNVKLNGKALQPPEAAQMDWLPGRGVLKLDFVRSTFGPPPEVRSLGDEQFKELLSTVADRNNDEEWKLLFICTLRATPGMFFTSQQVEPQTPSHVTLLYQATCSHQRSKGLTAGCALKALKDLSKLQRVAKVWKVTWLALGLRARRCPERGSAHDVAPGLVARTALSLTGCARTALPRACCADGVAPGEAARTALPRAGCEHIAASG
ncbi:hypothetical protein CYMTET_29311, partial [Cymbomonas tetramitiformis]